MPRPISPITQRVRDLFKARGTRPATWRDVAQDLAGEGVINGAAPSELQLVRRTLKNMAARGELQAVARVAVPGSRRPMTGWVTCQAGTTHRTRREGGNPVSQALSHLMQAWMA